MQRAVCSVQRAAVVIRTGAMTLAGMVKLGDFGLSQSVGPDGLLQKTAGTEALSHMCAYPMRHAIPRRGIPSGVAMVERAGLLQRPHLWQKRPARSVQR
jgi:hypothetical protein